jgi:DNA-binding NarL/FixJ family response regulator
MVSIRVLVGDDHPVVRAGLRMLIDDSEGLRFVGEAGTTREAVDAALRLRPDVLVLDVRMPGGGDGIDAARRIAALEPGIAILLLTMHDDPGAAVAALRAGARGFVLKDAGADAVVRAIRAVAAGELILGADVAAGLVELLAHTPSPVAQAFPQLTAREREIAELLATAASNGAIARSLGLSPKTVRNHVASICNKLGVLDRAQAVLRVREPG